MVKINRVYTGGGDGGESSLVDGSRRRKSDPRFSVVGTCDEANSWLAFATTQFFKGQDQELPASELVARYQMLFTDPSLTTVEDCLQASYYDSEGTPKLLTTQMMRERSPIFEELCEAGLSL